ncbi:hypothetical protein T484DRAFT_1813442, partial [Baffinella frigidus]
AHIGLAPYSLRVRSADILPSTTLITGSTIVTAGSVNKITILARDRFENYMDEGWLIFRATLFDALGREDYPPITDYKDGTYSVDLFVTLGGAYTLAIAYQDTTIASSPYTLSCVASNGRVTVGTCGVVSARLETSVQLRDAFGNINLITSPFVIAGHVTIQNATVTSVSTYRRDVIDGRDGDEMVFVDHAATRAGVYALDVTLDGVALGGPPFAFTLAAKLFADAGLFGAAGPGLTAVTAGTLTTFAIQRLGLTAITAGTLTTFLIQARDTFGNMAAADIGDSPFTIYAKDTLLEDFNVSVAVSKVGEEWRAAMTMTTSGAISFWISGLGFLAQGAPWTIDVQPGPVVARKSTAYGPGLKGYLTPNSYT